MLALSVTAFSSILEVVYPAFRGKRVFFYPGRHAEFESELPSTLLALC